MDGVVFFDEVVLCFEESGDVVSFHRVLREDAMV